ncbi:zinc finger CCHC domain-containing protein 2 isoform X1 [Parasteatoda tepidariorum]|nr:zinc finger CCHC domain-containing protein 2 isoform X1 [Parasteatoda tepidariorum]XP_042894837.1 zinc finger CCHC domain-containing protein 2 isoform X2 [Parasteatoda tepidariorum]
MVCKEDVYSWFQNLKASKRIEAICGILNMCYPIELRFYGTCIEDLGRKDFYVFKEDELKANDMNEIIKIRNIHESCMRSRLIVLLSLLNSSNFICAKEIFKVLCEEIKIENLAMSGYLLDSKVVDQYLLLLTIAQHHPAFTFEQQNFLTDLSLNLESYVRELENSRTKYELSTGLQQSNLSDKEIPNTAISYRYNSSQQLKSCDSPFEAQITSLKVKPPHKRMSIRIRVAWGSTKVTDAFKNPHDLFVFHKELVRMFPCEAKSTNQDKCIPPIPVAIATWNKQHTLNESIITCMAEYIQQLNLRLPGYVLENDFVRKFFMPSSSNRASISRNTKHVDHKQGELPPRSSRLRSLTIYNSQMSEKSPGHHPESRQKVLPNSCPRKYAEVSNYIPTSPAQSPLSSPYMSPENSATNSRAPSPWSSSVDRSTIDAPTDKFLTREPIIEHCGTGRNYREEHRTVPVDELQSLNISKDSGSKLTKAPDCKSPPNGVIGCYVPKKVLMQKSILNQSNSNDSSPICSEYSSPPQSPSPGDTCNQSSSLSSSNDENADKRPLSNLTSEFGKSEDSETNTSDSSVIKRDDDVLNVKGSVNRTSLSVIPLAIPYSTIVTQMPPLPNVKPAYLPIPCRTNSAPQHLSPSAVVYDHQFSRIPLASALTFIPGPTRSHPDRVMSSVSVSPFPVVTSGCSTSPSASCSITTYKSSNMTVVTNSGVTSNRMTQKNPIRDCDMTPKPLIQTSDTPYVTGYILNSSSPLTAVSCPCYTTNSARPSPAPSPSIGAAPQPSAVPVSLSYLGMPYLFHHSLPFLQTQPPSNGFVPQPGITNHGQGFTYTLPNGITTLPPELIYPEQTYSVQSPSTQGNPSQTASQGSQCYGAYSQTTAPPPQKLATCYNCGKVGHRGPDCKEPTMEDLSKSGKFHLNFIPVKAPDSHE